MVKVVTLFLIAMAVLALFGRFRVPGIRSGRAGMRRCKACGRPLVGKADCDCGKGTS